MARVGLLWDSLSANTGDQAVGLVLRRLAARAHIDGLEPVRIGRSLRRYGMLVIGGGELLHPAGHPFYDLFRVPGEHVLNTVGTYGEVAAAHLSDYRLVSVRSEADRVQLCGVTTAVRVVPCLTVLFPELTRARGGEQARKTIALHLHAGAVTPLQAVTLAAGLQRLGSRVAFLPFTHYNCDALLGARLARATGIGGLIDVANPDQAFAAIRRAGALVAASLHAVIFAYAAGVPFLALPYSPKVRHFLAERGLEERLLADPDGVADKAELLEPVSVDWHARLATDIAAAHAHSERVLTLVDEACRAAPRPWGGAWQEPTRCRREHAMMIARHAEYGRRQAELVGPGRPERSLARRLVECGRRLQRRWAGVSETTES